MSDDVRRALSVTADLRLDVDGVPATITADGARLTVVTADPLQLWSDLRSAPRPAGLDRPALRPTLRSVGELLDGSGLTTVVSGRSGPLLELGRDADSRLGRLLVGSPHVGLGRVRTLVPQALTMARRSPTVRAAATVSGLVAVGYAVGRRRR